MSRAAVRRGARAGAAVLLTAALAAGCGEDSGTDTAATTGPSATTAPSLSAEEQASADSLAGLFRDGGLESQDASCVAGRWVDGAGVETLQEAGILDKSGKAAQSNSTRPGVDVVEPYVEGYFACVDYGQYEAVKFDESRPGVIDKADFARCANAIDRAEAKAAMRDDLLGKQTKAATGVQHQLIECITAPAG